jgi:uncharacterized membrane protein
MKIVDHGETENTEEFSEAFSGFTGLSMSDSTKPILTEKPRGLARINIQDASSWILRVGVIASAVVMLIGILVTFSHGSQAISVERMTTDGFDFHPSHILAGIIAGRGKSIIEAGIYILVFTPIMRVFMSMLIFAIVEKDRLYAGITLMVLIMTLAGLLWLG